MPASNQLQWREWLQLEELPTRQALTISRGVAPRARAVQGGQPVQLAAGVSSSRPSSRSSSSKSSSSGTVSLGARPLGRFGRSFSPAGLVAAQLPAQSGFPQRSQITQEVSVLPQPCQGGDSPQAWCEPSSLAPSITSKSGARAARCSPNAFVATAIATSASLVSTSEASTRPSAVGDGKQTRIGPRPILT